MKIRPGVFNDQGKKKIIITRHYATLEMCGARIAGFGGLPLISLDSFYPCCSFPLVIRKPKETYLSVLAPCTRIILIFVNNTRTDHDCCQRRYPRGNCCTPVRASAPQLMRNTLFGGKKQKEQNFCVSINVPRTDQKHGNLIQKTTANPRNVVVISRNYSESKIQRVLLKINFYILARQYFSSHYNYIVKFIISKRGVFLALHNFSELKILADNAKIRLLLKLYGISFL